MQKVFCVTRDSRLDFQLRRWLTDLIDDFEWTCVASPDELHLPGPPAGPAENQLPDSTSDPATLEDSGPTSNLPKTSPPAELPPPLPPPDPNLIPPYIILIDDLTRTQIQAGDLHDIKLRFTIVGAVQGEPLILLIAPEDSGHPSEMYKLTGCDDLIRKPVDRSVFLQKIEIMRARGKSVTPTFLFKLKTKSDVNIGKDCVVEALSETECLVRNPRALHANAHVTLYASVFGTGANEKADARVLDSWPHPTVPGECLIRLRLFGLTERQLRSIRLFAKAQGVKIHKPGTRRPSAEIESTLNEADKVRATRRATFVVIDFDESTARTIQSSLNDVADIDIKPFKGLTRFLHAIAPPPPKLASEAAKGDGSKATLLPAAGPKEASAGVSGSAAVSLPADVAVVPNAAQASVVTQTQHPPAHKALSEPSISLVIAGGSGRLIKFETKLIETDMFLGLTLREWSTGERTLSERFQPSEVPALQEFFSWVLTRGRGEIRLQFKSSDSLLIPLNIKAEKWRQAEDSDESVIHLEVTLAPTESDASTSAEQLKIVDAILIEAVFLGSNVESTLAIIKKSLTDAGIVNSFGHEPPLIVLADPDEKLSPHAYRNPDITHFVYKTVDRRFYIQTFFSLARREFWKVGALVEPLITSHIVGQLARESHLEEIAEYGFVIKETFPFRLGIFLRIFSTIFGETSAGALGRCIGARQLNDKEWVSEFVFFGSSDALQKKIRNYILEDHIEKKKASGE